jgi:hypothetical protein
VVRSPARYFKDDRDKKALGIIPLRDMQNVRPTSGGKPGRLEFDLVTKERTYFLWCGVFIVC